MAYPTTKTTFTDPEGTTRVDTGVDHAAAHKGHNDLLEAIEDTVGTTAGTNVLKNFAAGDFPARINASNVLQQRVSGTVDNAVLGTPTVSAAVISSGTISMNAGTLNNAEFGSPRLTLGSDATGDTYYRNAGGSVARLGIGATNKVLTVTGGLPAWETAAVNVASNSGCHVYAGTTMNIALGGTATKITTLTSEDYDLGTEYDTSNQRFVVGTAGKYLISAKVLFNANMEADKSIAVMIYLNGANIGQDIRTVSYVASYPTAQVTRMVSLSAGGTIEIYAQNTGTAVHELASGVDTYVSIQRIA